MNCTLMRMLMVLICKIIHINMIPQKFLIAGRLAKKGSSCRIQPKPKICQSRKKFREKKNFFEKFLGNSFSLLNSSTRKSDHNLKRASQADLQTFDHTAQVVILMLCHFQKKIYIRRTENTGPTHIQRNAQQA